MQHYAQTYPQLMNQAIVLGLGDDALIALRRTHELAAAAVDGMYRASGGPFLDHLTRTASVVLAQRAELPVVQAAQLHALYILHTFDGSRRRAPGNRRRREVAALIGERGEALIAAYGTLAWSNAAVIDGYRSALNESPVARRQLLLLRLANELEDHLDQATLYSQEYALEGSQLRLAAASRLARDLGHGALADELTEVMPEKSVPRALVFERRIAFARSVRPRWQALWPEYLLYRTWRFLKRRIPRRS